MSDSWGNKVSQEGYSVTLDEKRYFRQLCDGSKTAEQIADEVAELSE